MQRYGNSTNFANLLCTISFHPRFFRPPTAFPLTAATLAETKRTFETRYRNAAFDLVYFHAVDGATEARVESDEGGVTVVGCEYRKYLPGGGLHHEIDNSQIVVYLKDNVSVPDPRSEEEKAKYAAEWKKQDAARWHGGNAFETFVNRSAFRMYRKLEKFLTKKGLMPPERPLWFGVENEPR